MLGVGFDAEPRAFVKKFSMTGWPTAPRNTTQITHTTKASTKPTNLLPPITGITARFALITTIAGINDVMMPVCNHMLVAKSKKANTISPAAILSFHDE